MKIRNQLVATVSVVMLLASTALADHHLKPLDLTGVWKATATSDGNTRNITWTFTKKGDELSGTSVDGDSGEKRELDRIAVSEKKVTLEIDIEQDGNTGVIRVEAEEKTAGKLDGKWTIVDDNGNVFMSGEVTAVKEVALAGAWDATATLPDGVKLKSVLELKGKNSDLKGLLSGDAGENKINKVTMSDQELHLEFDVDMNGESFNVVIKAKAEGDNKLVGKWMVDDAGAEGDWSAVRKVESLAGVWNVVAKVPDNDDYTGTLTLKEADGKYTAVSKGTDSDGVDATKVKVNAGGVEVVLPFNQAGYSGTITIEAARQKDGGLKGEWALVGDDGTEYIRESWKATRQ